MEAKDLNQKIELWGMVEVIDSLKNPVRTEQKIKDIWTKIIPKHGKVEQLTENAESVGMTVVVICRKLSIKEPNISMFFRRKGITYETIDFIEDMKTRSFWEFTCKVVYE